jgi:glycosyltransferase involved in cell wall biosynthesis
MLEGVSVIICCYNGELRIAETIRYLGEQKVPDDMNWEVIVVNNASTDSTRIVAAQSWAYKSNNALFRVVDEWVPGLSSARQKGIDVARFDTLIFCDDDNHLDPDYVFRARQLMRSKAGVGVMGGWVRPKLSVYPGRWIEDFYPSLAIGKQSEQDGYVDWVFGAGMILRKEVFETLKKRKIALMLSDRVGNKQTSGGDAEICITARFVGYKIFYSNKLILDHQIAAYRLTKQGFIKGNYRNVFPLIYLYLMEGMMKNKAESIDRMYRNFFAQRISLIFHFLPRWLFGKHRFYSFIMLYQNIQLFLWLLTRRTYFINTAQDIKKNLYHAGE